MEFDSGFVKLPYDFEIGYQGSELRSAKRTNKCIIAKQPDIGAIINSTAAIRKELGRPDMGRKELLRCWVH